MKSHWRVGNRLRSKNVNPMRELSSIRKGHRGNRKFRKIGAIFHYYFFFGGEGITCPCNNILLLYNNINQI